MMASLFQRLTRHVREKERNPRVKREHETARIRTGMRFREFLFESSCPSCLIPDPILPEETHGSGFLIPVGFLGNGIRDDIHVLRLYAAVKENKRHGVTAATAGLGPNRHYARVRDRRTTWEKT